MLIFLNAHTTEMTGMADRIPSACEPRPAPVLLCLAAMIGALSTGSTCASENDALNVFASASYSHESNLFRVPDDQPGYQGIKDDNFKSLMAGLSFKQTFGRQAFSIDAQTSKVAFDRFAQLDYTAKTGRLEWGWHLGNHLEGKAGVSYAETLAPYTDVVTNERNLRTEQHSFASGAWNFHPSWRARLGGDYYRYKYDLLSQSLNNHQDDRGEAGIDYLAGSGSSVGLQVNALRRKYDLQRTANGQLVDAGSDQTDLKLRVVWQATPVTLLQFLGGRSKRTYNYTNGRDSQGVNARLSASSVVAGKLRLSSSVWREYAGVDSTLASYSLNNGASVTGLWAISAKVQATADAKYVRRKFEGLLASRLPQGFADSTKSYSVGLSYTPWPLLTLSSNVYREARSGGAFLGSGSYHANGVSFAGNLQF